MTRFMDVSWAWTKALFFSLGVYFLLSSLLEFKLGADGHEYAILLAGLLGLIAVIPAVRGLAQDG